MGSTAAARLGLAHQLGAMLAAGGGGPVVIEELDGNWSGSVQRLRAVVEDPHGTRSYVVYHAPTRRDRPALAAQVRLMDEAVAHGIDVPHVIAWMEDTAGGEGASVVAAEAPASVRARPTPSLVADCGALVARLQNLRGGELPFSGDLLELSRARTARLAEPEPVFELALRWLSESRPSRPRRPVPVHGDLDAASLIRRDGRVTGMSSWHRAHLGDPHEDLASLLVGWRCVSHHEATTVRRLCVAYEEHGGRRVSPRALRWWLVLRNLDRGLGALEAASTAETDQATALRALRHGRRASRAQWNILELLCGPPPSSVRGPKRAARSRVHGAPSLERVLGAAARMVRLAGSGQGTDDLSAVLEIATREARLGLGHELSAMRLFMLAGVRSIEELAGAVRACEGDGMGELEPVLWELVRMRLEVDDPEYLRVIADRR